MSQSAFLPTRIIYVRVLLLLLGREYINNKHGGLSLSCYVGIINNDILH